MRPNNLIYSPSDFIAFGMRLPAALAALAFLCSVTTANDEIIVKVSDMLDHAAATGSAPLTDRVDALAAILNASEGVESDKLSDVPF